MAKLTNRQIDMLKAVGSSLANKNDSRSKKILELIKAQENKEALSSDEIEILKLAIAQFFIDRRKADLKNKQRREAYKEKRKKQKSLVDYYFSKSKEKYLLYEPFFVSCLIDFWQGEITKERLLDFCKSFDEYRDCEIKDNAIKLVFDDFRYFFRCLSPPSSRYNFLYMFSCYPLDSSEAIFRNDYHKKGSGFYSSKEDKEIGVHYWAWVRNDSTS